MIRHAKCYREGYPRPRFVRDTWTNLNGEWAFSFDDQNEGERKRWYLGGKLSGKIVVPFAYQTQASGIGDERRHDHLWYERRFIYQPKRGKRLLLCFEGADYAAKIWLNGKMLGKHVGGYSRFILDASEAVRRGENILVVKCDDSYAYTQPRGKQRCVPENVSCFYTDTSGLWKTVWMEEVSDSSLAYVMASCEYEQQSILFEYEIRGYREGLTLEIEAEFDGKRVAEIQTKLYSDSGKVRLELALRDHMLDMKPWSIGRPWQYFDLTYRLRCNGAVLDEVRSYTALVDYRTRGNRIEVNYLPCYYFRMVLAQGYYPESGLTPKNDEELLRDVLLIKEMGFNGVRMHQKIEDERFYYFCDMAGLFCWLEMPAIYAFTSGSACELMREWTEIVLQYKGYLSIMAYVPINESWGVLQTSENEQMQQLTAGLYSITKALDPTRLVISNDGWEHTRSDIVTLHNYAPAGQELALAYGDLPAFLRGELTGDLHTRAPFADGWKYEGQPVIISEYGGIAYRTEEAKDWGYGNAASSERELLERMRDLTSAIVDVAGCQGYCYTQFTDVMQEKNGLLTEDRKPKADPAEIRKINSVMRKS